MTGTLYLVPNFLGEEQDLNVLSPQSIQIVQNTQYFAVENGKDARKFIKAIYPAVDFSTHTYFDINKKRLDDDVLKEVIQALINGNDVAVITDAGCPGIADPGEPLVRMAHINNIRVKPLVGPSSLLLALMASGMNGQRFEFHGYVPIQEPELRSYLRNLEKESSLQSKTQLFIETPYRNEKLIQFLLKNLQPDTWLGVAMNLTQSDEWVKTLQIKDWKKLKLPNLNKKPAVFSVYAGT